jgi:hypothetical protein
MRRLLIAALVVGLGLGGEAQVRMRFVVPSVVSSAHCGNGQDFTLCDATNTGLAGAGIAEGSLTGSGGAAYTSANNGQTITNRKYTGTVTLTGVSNFTIDGCLMETGSGAATQQFTITNGSNITIKNCTIRVSGGGGVKYNIVQFGSTSNLVLEKLDISGGENNVGWNDTAASPILRYSYLHGLISSDSDPHYDNVEVYGGTFPLIEHNTILMRVGVPVATVNVAPWSGGNSVTDLSVQDNFLDYGQGHFTIDNQAGGIRRVRIKRNRMGGHHSGGVGGDFMAGLFYDTGRDFVETEGEVIADPVKILMPTTGADKNYWYYCCSTAPSPFGFANLSPNKTNVTVTSADWIFGSTGTP